MKMRNKGKVQPFTSSSLQNPNKEDFPVLKLLPAAIFALVSVLSLDDREVLAYMIARSLKSTNNPPFTHHEDKRRSLKKLSSSTNLHGRESPALFDCECFYCYTSFWCRWDSSHNRELIHQAIEEFEEHLSNGEVSISCGNGKNKRKERMGRRRSGRVCAGVGVIEIPVAVPLPENQESTNVIDPPGSELGAEVGGMVYEAEMSGVPPEFMGMFNSRWPESEAGAEVDDMGGVVYEAEMGDVAVAAHSHKGLARKVLPDVMGIFNSRLWSLWSPNV